MAGYRIQSNIRITRLNHNAYMFGTIRFPLIASKVFTKNNASVSNRYTDAIISN